jgi:hypothetical protein
LLIIHGCASITDLKPDTVTGVSGNKSARPRAREIDNSALEFVPLRLCCPHGGLLRGVDRCQRKHVYWFVQGWKEPHQFTAGSIFHLIEPDFNQEIYGLPEYLSALNSAWLNEAATLFRRKYYQNGAHAGYILYMTDAAQSSSDIDSMRKAMRDTKGLGNFRNLFMYAPNGKKDGIQILPLSEVATKNDFFNIKKSSRDCKHTRFSSTHFLRFPYFRPSACTLPASGYSEIHEVARCYIPSASAL